MFKIPFSFQDFLTRYQRGILSRGHRTFLIAGTLIAGWGFVVFMGALFFMPRTVRFSYAGSTCFYNPVVLPQTVKATSSSRYKLTTQTAVRVGGYPLLSTKTCVEAIAAPYQNESEALSMSPHGLPLLKKPVTVKAPAYPLVTSTLTSGGKISAKDALKFKLSEADTHFDYTLFESEKAAQCTKKDLVLSCQLTPLSLLQAHTYTVSLKRFWHGAEAGIVTTQTLTSIEPVTITSQSIAANATVYSVPADVTFTLSKPGAKVSDFTLEQVNGGSRTVLPATVVLEGTALKFVFGSPLPRNANIELTITDIEATDHSFLAAPFVLPFKTSGGPAVSGVSIGSYKVSPSTGYTVTFDVALEPHQVAANYIAVVSAGQNIPVTTSLNGRTITVTPKTQLAPCTLFTIKVLAGLTNEFGVGGGSAWQFNSRTICQTVFSIGSSVQGRNITAYKFGSGSNYVVYVGAIHGNEKSSATILNQWIEALEASPEKIPAGRAIVVIPVINPDGFASTLRTNAHNTDLNRNFPAYDWKSSVVMPDKSTNPSGGGTAPLSEPESAALAQYINGVRPRLVLTYHATAGVVIPNNSGDSDALAHVYDKNSNLYYKSNDQTGTIFEYDTTGAFEDWLHDAPNIPALLVETWTMTGNEFAKHINALWAMAQS